MKPEQQQIITEIIKLMFRIGPNYPYHNKDHIMRVYEASQLYASRARLSSEETFLLGIAALFHDIIYKKGDNDNESNSAKYATNYMKSKGFSNTHIKIVENLILATHMPTHPRTELEKLMCDADLDYLGTDSYFSIENTFRKEEGISDDKEWLNLQIGFLNKHKYYSSIAKNLRNKKKEENLETVKSMLKKLTK